MKRLFHKWFRVGVLSAAGTLALSALAAAAALEQASPLATVPAAPLERSAPAVVQPQRAMLFAIARAGKRLVAVGEHGVIALSDDNGLQWRAAKVPVDVNLTALAFADAQHGWAIGHQGVVLHSADAGETWHKQLDGLSAANVLLAYAQQQTGAARDELLYQAEGLVADGADKPLLDLLVEDRSTITVIGAFNLALRSRDGGQSWQAFSQQLDNPGGMHLYALEKIDNQLLAVGEQGLLLKSAAPDALLSAQASPYDGSYFGLLPLGRQRVLVYGLRGNAFVSADAGASWQAAQIPGNSNATFNAALQRSNGDVLLLDQSGRVHLSRDQGREFRTLAFEWGAPLTGAVETASGGVLLSSLAGIVELPPAALAATASEE